VLSTAMSFLGLLPANPVVAQGHAPDATGGSLTLSNASSPPRSYLVVPPSDISRTKAAGAACAQSDRTAIDRGALRPRRRRHRLLLMLDEFPALGRLDFFETALALHGGLRPQELP